MAVLLDTSLRQLFLHGFIKHHKDRTKMIINLFGQVHYMQCTSSCDFLPPGYDANKSKSEIITSIGALHIIHQYL